METMWRSATCGRATAFLENGEKEADSEHDMEKSSQTRLYCYIDLFADCTNFFNYILPILHWIANQNCEILHILRKTPSKTDQPILDHKVAHHVQKTYITPAEYHWNQFFCVSYFSLLFRSGSHFELVLTWCGCSAIRIITIAVTQKYNPTWHIFFFSYMLMFLNRA